MQYAISMESRLPTITSCFVLVTQDAVTGGWCLEQVSAIRRCWCKSRRLIPNLLDDQVSPPIFVVPMAKKEFSKERIERFFPSKSIFSAYDAW